jgi:hypothetical protein
MIAALVLCGSTARSQDLRLDLSAGFGSYFAEENETFSTDAMFASLRGDVLGFNFMDATSGIGVDVHTSQDLNWKVWSLNRASVIGDRMFAGTDFKLFESNGGGAEENFDFRLVTGSNLGKAGPGSVLVEFYALEEDRPIAFAIVYKW